MNHPTIQRVRHELKLRELEVARIERLSPGFLAITFKGDALADFTSLSFDDHVKLMFDDEGAQVRRDYTPRRFSREARELTLEFALHGDGKAANWARRARVGDRALVGGPRGSMIIPLELDWHLLAGDASALPAIARRLEELPAGAPAQVLVLAGAADERPLPSRADTVVRRVASEDELIAALAGMALPAGAGFAWAAGEAALMARVRRVLADKELPRERTRVSAYWKHGVTEHHEHLD
jgi:NADPH-dependent ferric siderophore reductase